MPAVTTPGDALAPAPLVERFVSRFGGRPRVFRAPGRINVIGEHTDYSGGYAMPAAIDRCCIVAIAPNTQAENRLVSLTLGEESTSPADRFVRERRWTDYVNGVAAVLRAAGRDIPPFDLMIDSDVPLGAGVSSSAALEVATALGLAELTGGAAPRDIADWAWCAETRFVGAPCGPMDQFASVHGKAGHALLLDCRALEATRLAWPATAGLFLVNSGVRHAIVDGGYAARRQDCEAAAEILGVAQLRDAPSAQLEAANLPERLFRRARHVLSENERVLQAARALRNDDLTQMGALMTASHASLRDDFDVTCPETDRIVEVALTTDGVFGARQMGGGFGGCVLVLAARDQLAHAVQQIASTCANTGWFACTLADGAREITL